MLWARFFQASWCLSNTAMHAAGGSWFTKRFGFSCDPSMSMGSKIYISFILLVWSKYMAQSPKGSFVHGFYNPIHGDCAIYFYPGVYRRTDSQWNFSNGYLSTWSKLSNTTQNVAKKTAESRRGNHPSIPPFVATCVHAICVHVSSLQVII